MIRMGGTHSRHVTWWRKTHHRTHRSWNRREPWCSLTPSTPGALPAVGQVLGGLGRVRILARRPAPAKRKSGRAQYNCVDADEQVREGSVERVPC